ncbi:MAG TPA: hypothetical protein VGT05_01785 [Patescibacteria group bacterium]|nr:hypothetical protein [Patescibacteria group bacterium]
MEEPLLKSSLVEVAWQHIGNKKPSFEDKHYHKKAVEITIVLKGSATFLANGIKQIAYAGDFWVVYPQTVIEEFATGDDTEFIVIKAPSILGDKYIS